MNGMFILACAAYTVAGLPYHIDIRRDVIRSPKITKPVKIAVISDLHCRPYGKKQERIRKIIEQEKPDIVLLPGDLFDVGRNLTPCFDLLEILRGYPVYFSSGNHENWIDNMEELREKTAAYGVHVLENKAEKFNEEIEIIGLSDPGHGNTVYPEDYDAIEKEGGYQIVLSHRPDFRECYNAIDADLVISGHAHGGQWRTPLWHIPLASPGEGIFPKYTDGIHDMNGTLLYISRGMASGNPYIPRLYNNPEIGMIELKGEEGR